MEELGGNPQRLSDGSDWLHVFLVYELHGDDPLPLLALLQAGEGKFKASLYALKLGRHSNAFAIKTKVIEDFDNFFRDKRLRNETYFIRNRLSFAA